VTRIRSSEIPLSRARHIHSPPAQWEFRPAKVTFSETSSFASSDARALDSNDSPSFESNASAASPPWRPVGLLENILMTIAQVRRIRESQIGKPDRYPCRRDPSFAQRAVE
jgi:hypothetical protein